MTNSSTTQQDHATFNLNVNFIIKFQFLTQKFGSIFIKILRKSYVRRQKHLSRFPKNNLKFKMLICAKQSHKLLSILSVFNLIWRKRSEIMYGSDVMEYYSRDIKKMMKFKRGKRRIRVSVGNKRSSDMTRLNIREIWKRQWSDVKEFAKRHQNLKHSRLPIISQESQPNFSLNSNTTAINQCVTIQIKKS